MDRKPQGRFNMGKTHMDAIECISLIRDNAVCLFSLEAGKDTTMDSEDLFKTIVVGPDRIGRPGTFNPFGPIVSDQIVPERTRAMFQEMSEYTKIEDIKVGEAVHRWGDKLLVTALIDHGETVTVFYLDDDGETKMITDRKGSQYLVHHIQAKDA